MAASVCEYAIATSPGGSDVVVMLGRNTTVMDNDAGVEVMPALSLTVTLKEDVPVLLGVPLITPVDVFSERPAGSFPLVNVQV